MYYKVIFPCQSAISDDYVLTAAHCCVFPFEPSKIEIDIGQYNTMEQDKGEFKVKALRIFPHEDYRIEKSGVPRNDICLIQVASLRLTAPHDCNGCYAPVCIPQLPTIAYPGRHCWIAGWGNTAAIDLIDPGRSGEIISFELRDVGVNIFSYEYCLQRTIYTEKYVNRNTDICAGIADWDNDGMTDGGKDSCQGDSGGPLICVEENQPIQVGIVSWGNGCAAENSAGVYVNVYAYKNWIENKSGLQL